MESCYFINGCFDSVILFIILRVEEFYEKHKLTNVWNFYMIEITVNESQVSVVIYTRRSYTFYILRGMEVQRHFRLPRTE